MIQVAQYLNHYAEFPFGVCTCLQRVLYQVIILHSRVLACGFLYSAESAN